MPAGTRSLLCSPCRVAAAAAVWTADQSIKKISFGNFRFSAAEAENLHKQVVP